MATTTLPDYQPLAGDDWWDHSEEDHRTRAISALQHAEHHARASERANLDAEWVTASAGQAAAWAQIAAAHNAMAEARS
jgi:hypothetical protein